MKEMTKDMLSHNETKRRMFIFVVSCILFTITILQLVHLVTDIMDATILFVLFFTTLWSLETWGESIGAARFQYQQKKDAADD